MNNKYQAIEDQITKDMVEYSKGSNHKYKKIWIISSIIGALICLAAVPVGIVIGLLVIRPEENGIALEGIVIFFSMVIIGYTICFPSGFLMIKYNKNAKKTLNIDNYYQSMLEAITGATIENFAIKEIDEDKREWIQNSISTQSNQLTLKSHFIDFDYKGKSVTFGRMTHSFPKYITDIQGGVWKFGYFQTYFRMIDKKSIFKTDIEILFNNRKKEGKNSGLISLESDKFNHLVSLYCENEVEARKNFPPIKMDNIITFFDKDSKASLDFLEVKNHTYFGQVRPNLATTKKISDFTDFKFRVTTSKTAKSIFQKIYVEAKDIADILKLVDLISA